MLLANALMTVGLLAAGARDEVSAEVVLEGLDLTVVLPEMLTGLAESPGRGPGCRGRWRGKLDQNDFELSLWVYAQDRFRVQEPDEITDNAIDSGRSQGQHLTVGGNQFVHGKAVGYPGYASIQQAVRTNADGSKGLASWFALGALLPDHVILLRGEARPVLSTEQAERVVKYLEEALDYSGPARDNNWTDEEATTRWNEHAPESARGKEFRKPYRTKHYIILTDFSDPKTFARKLEECYKKIQKVYPFPEVPGRRLMPIFLFQTNQEYYEYYASIAGVSLDAARASKGHAWKDYYATYYESPNDPVHIHEATHQIFANRLRLNGGGSWFQEGVAEYIETSENARNVVASLVKKDRAPAMRELMKLQSLLYSAEVDQRTGNQAGNNYTQAALFIEFLRQSRAYKKHFQEFLHAVGRVARNDLAGIARALQQVYGKGIDELQADFQKYCARR